jgi:hypothetical protein
LLKENDYFTLTIFSTEAKVKFDDKITDENKIKIINIINNLYAFGGTNISEGLFTALNLINNNKKIGSIEKRYIILFTGIFYSYF